MIKNNTITGFRTVEQEVDLCVVGGGIAGMFTAISAARHGIKVAIMQDRPMYGGNASSEIRMWIRGAHNNKETGLLEELSLRNIYRNPTMNFSVWDSVMYEMVMENHNIAMLLNCSCCHAEMCENKIISVTGWQTTTQTWQKVNAAIFADCSGDSVLAPLTGAEYRMGREAKSEFNEDIAPEESDNCTMGLSCLFQVRELDAQSKFIAPEWAHHYSKKDFPYRINFDKPKAWTTDNYWWIEIGGINNSIEDTEVLRDELLKITYGVWDFIKNSGELDSDNWELDWVGMLPGKRESRRYVGDYILTQNDVRTEGKFDDLVAYGGWTMDDHNPKGFDPTVMPTIWHPAPSPFGIPYRSMYSKNICNLMFAGRNISCTHTAMSASRVMATCGVIGQAVGTAASIAVKNNFTPRDVYKEKIDELKQTLMEDDCFLPFNSRKKSKLMEESLVSDDVLFNGIDRDDNFWEGKFDQDVIVSLKKTSKVGWIEYILDSDLHRKCWNDQKWYKKDFVMKCNSHIDDKPLKMPGTLLKSFSVFIDKGNGKWESILEESSNQKRVVRIPVNDLVKQIKILPHSSWGSNTARIYSIYFK